MLLSIIVPTYNRADRLCAVIQAYLSHIADALGGEQCFELILVNDGSTDSTASRIEQLSEYESAIISVNLSTNQGPGLARDQGLKVASGKWVWFLDDDDQLLKGSLHALLDLLLNVSESTTTIAHSLKQNYSKNKCGGNISFGLISNVLNYQEQQEVFNFVIKRQIILDNNIKFSSGVHEDIRYVFDVLRFSSSITVLEEKVVEKKCSDDSITLGMSTRRISGYLNAVAEVVPNLELLHLKSGMESLSLNSILTQTIGVILYQIDKEKTQNVRVSLYRFLGKALRSKNFSALMLDELSLIRDEPRRASTTNFKLATCIFLEYINTLSPQWSKVDTSIKDVYASRLSCRDLDKSIFLGPNEIRACCKRFYFRGKREGDVVLLKSNSDVTFEDVQNAKSDLLSKINSGEPNSCDGCPYLERRTAENERINYISLENFSYCNMRCDYCSPKYYGGSESSYSALGMVKNLMRDESLLDERCQVVWGGGEPTLSPIFKDVNRQLVSSDKIQKIRVLTNSLKFSEELFSLLEDPRVHIVTSIDAGSEAIFRSIRGRGTINAVLDNLQKYQQAMSDIRRLTIKYIVRSDNCSSSELENFVAKIVSQNLIGSVFQISCDFQLNRAGMDVIKGIYELSTRLLSAEAHVVVFDDLIRDRVSVNKAQLHEITRHLDSLGLNNRFLVSADHPQEVVLWGVGLQSEWYQNHTTAGDAGLLDAAVYNQDDLTKLGSEFLKNEALILPCGVQSLYEILQNIETGGLSSRLARVVIA
ncbi:MAG: sulfatase maturation enzyme AslB (radical SAM superfamily) [Neptuniibacter pectenicola]|jgi:sulfatase maturation enzyme AslB (radical SAM superfamily)|uniref:glycosyltransferase n=1 Tax=Neptuniibacter pectenicola TaxID=1806669 RepID=UPI003ADF97E2